MTTIKKLYLHKIITSVIGCMFVIYSTNAANVSARGAQRATQTAARANIQKSTAKTPATDTTTTATTAKTESEPKTTIKNKSSQFDDILSEIKEIEDISIDQDLAAKIKQQRDAFNAESTKETTATKFETALTTKKNDCDQKLRACMKSKCGEDFTKCAGDTDTIWGDKLDLCRQKITCTGTEYNLFTREIKADRDSNQQLTAYQSIVNCGNTYNNCIITQCGTTFSNCLGKSASDNAIKTCEKIANECKQHDSGMPARAMEVIGNLRVNAEESITRDEQRLYDLRDKMRETCEHLGALFDDRTLDCIYSIQFRGGENDELFASKKAYAGSSFNCDADWFGVDVTTFMENAARLTRSQKSASSAAMGAGIGVGVGAATSGAIDRATDRAKAERALGQELCEQNGKGTWNKATNTCKCSNPDYKFDKEKGCMNKEQERQKKLCTSTKGGWTDDNECQCEAGKRFDTGRGCITVQTTE